MSVLFKRVYCSKEYIVQKSILFKRKYFISEVPQQNFLNLEMHFRFTLERIGISQTSPGPGFREERLPECRRLRSKSERSMPACILE